MTRSAESDVDRRLATWRRFEPAVLGVLPYGLVGVSVAITLIVPPDGTHARVALAVLTVAAVAWIALVRPSFGTLQDGSRRALVYSVGIIVLSGGLVYLQPWFAFFAFLGYLNAIQFHTGSTRWTMLAVTAVVISSSQVGGFQNIDGTLAYVAWAAIAVVNFCMAGVFGHYGDLTERQSEQRARTITELAEANHRLEAALAENAGLHEQLLTQAREAGITHERQRLAREIHDTIAQGLAGIVTQLEAAEQAASQDERLRRVGLARSLARESLGEARRSVQALQPERLTDARLPDALGLMAKRWSETYDVPVHVETTGDPAPLAPEVEVTLYRVTQEALGNVARHAAADRAVVTLSYLDDAVTLDVVDDGRGFVANDCGEGDPVIGADGPSGFGLRTMRQRAVQVGGRLSVESEPGRGTAVSVAVPTGGAA